MNRNNIFTTNNKYSDLYKCIFSDPKSTFFKTEKKQEGTGACK